MVSLWKRIITRFLGSTELKASTAYLVCSIVQKGMTILTLPLFTRILTKEEYGISTIYTSTMAVMIIFTSLNLPYGSFSPAMMKFESDRNGYISAVNTLCILLTGIYFSLYFLFRDFWNDLLDLPTILMIMMGIEMLMTTSTQFWMGKARFEYKYKEFAIVTIVTSLFACVCSICAVFYFDNKGVAKIIASSVVTSSVGFTLLIQSIKNGRKCFNKEYWHYALSFNIPLIPYYVSQMIFNQSDRIMIDRMTGRSDAAMYGVAYSLAIVLVIVLNAINNAFVPWMYRRIKERDFQANKSISFMITCFMAIMLLVLIATAPEIIVIMAGEQYSYAVWVVPPVAMSLLLLFYTQLFANVEFYFEEKYKLVGASIFAAIINVILNYYGIRTFGFIAAGYTTLISYIVFAVSNYVAMKNVCREKGIEEDIYNLKLLIIVFVVFAIIGFGFTALYTNRTIRYSIIFSAIGIGILLRRNITIAYKQIIEVLKRSK